MSDITVSLVILTWNRKASVERSLSANLNNAGYPVREIIHVDNGSEDGYTDWFKKTFKPKVQVCHDTNLGVATGYNRGLVLATSSHIVITGCDRVMPDNWLHTFADAIKSVPNTGVISCYTAPHTERYRGEEVQIGGYHIRRSIPVEARIHSRSFLHLTGYWREDFGIYGYEDSEWSDRAEARARENGLINYIIPSMGYAKHLSDQDFHLKPEGKIYSQYKNEIHADPRRKALWLRCHGRNSPYYNPYSRLEPDLLGEVK